MKKPNHNRKFKIFLKKQKRRRLYRLKKQKEKRLSVVQRRYRELIYQSHQVKLPETFSIRDNTVETIKFINELKQLRTNRQRIFINLNNVKKITNGSIALLVSVINELSAKGYRISGNKPKDSESNKILEKSGFFSHMSGDIEYDNQFTANTILEEGHKTISPQLTAGIVRCAMKTIFGSEKRNKKLQGLFIELMANSINHGFPNKEKKKWIISTSHLESEKSVNITFIDNGVGILKTLELKILRQLLTVFTGKHDLLLAAFKGEIGSRTGLSYRGKGLPFIFDSVNRNYISNLLIITNNVILDFKNQKFYDIGINFSGTFYYFELNDENNYDN